MLKKILNALLKSHKTKKQNKEGNYQIESKTIVIGPKSFEIRELDENFPCYTRHGIKVIK